MPVRKSVNTQGHTVLAMITTAGHHRWPRDVGLANYKAAGLHTSCIVRLKLFTLDNRLIPKRIATSHLTTASSQLAASDLPPVVKISAMALITAWAQGSKNSRT